MWSPPHHFDLQPIELVWDNVNSNVGRQYTTTTTLVDVKSRLKSAFATLDTKTLAGCMNKAGNILAELLNRIILMEFIEEDEETTYNADYESSNDSLGSR